MKSILALCLLSVCAFSQTHYLIEGDRGVVARSLPAGVQSIPHQDLLPWHTMARLTADQRAALSLRFKVIEASGRLARGERAPACQHIVPPQFVTPTTTDGWDGPGRGAATLTYSFGNMQPISGESAAANIEYVKAAMQKLSNVVMVDFLPGSDPLAEFHSHIYVGTDGDHHVSCPFPFNGAAVAHAFTPAWGYSWRWGGDVHFNSAFSFHTYRFPAVALHEFMHVLGLMHSDVPNSAVYQYYNGIEQLSAEDVQALLTLYAPRNGGEIPGTDRDGRNGPVPLSASLTGPASTPASSAILTGSISGGVPPYVVQWSINGVSQPGFSSGASFNLTVPLPAIGTYTVSATVTDSAVQPATAGASFAVTRTPEDGRGGRGN